MTGESTDAGTPAMPRSGTLVPTGRITISKSWLVSYRYFVDYGEKRRQRPSRPFTARANNHYRRLAQSSATRLGSSRVEPAGRLAHVCVTRAR
jgi:hypothetical protein